MPLALAGSRGDFHGVRKFAERDHANIVSWNVYDVNSHYLPHSAPDLITADIVKFYAGLRSTCHQVALPQRTSPQL